MPDETPGGEPERDETPGVEPEQRILPENATGHTDAPPEFPVQELADTGQAGKIEVIRTADLNVDPTYQRDISRALVDKIKADWDTAGAGYIVVNRRPNGSLYVVNGQHRVAARMELAMAEGDESGGEIVAQVFEGLSPQQEAKLRLIGNTKRTDSSLERFRAQVAAGNAESLAIVEILKQFGTRINPNPDMHGGINAVSAVEQIFRVNNGSLLQRTLEVINDAVGTVAGKAGSVAMLKGVAWTLQRHQAELDVRRLVDRIGAEGVDAIDRRARTHKASSGGSLWTNYYRALVEAYNHRLPDRSKIEVRVGGWSVSALAGGSWETQ